MRNKKRHGKGGSGWAGLDKARLQTASIVGHAVLNPAVPNPAVHPDAADPPQPKHASFSFSCVPRRKIVRRVRPLGWYGVGWVGWRLGNRYSAECPQPRIDPPLGSSGTETSCRPSGPLWWRPELFGADVTRDATLSCRVAFEQKCSYILAAGQKIAICLPEAKRAL